MTRENSHLAHEIARVVDNVNDQIDSASYFSRRIHPDNGSTLMIWDRVAGEYVTPTLAQVQERVLMALNAANNYITMYRNFQASAHYAKVNSVLATLSMTRVELEGDIDDYETVVSTALGMVTAATTEAEMVAAADYIDTNTTKIVLMRRSWNW